MMHLLRTTAIFFALVRRGHSESLSTAFTGPNDDIWSDGDKFAIVTGDTSVTIDNFDIHMAEVTEDVQIWMTEGFFGWSYVWDKHSKILTETVTGLGQGVATPLPAFSPPIQILANSTVGFYVTLADADGDNMYHSDGVLENTVFASDANIGITEGMSHRHFMAQYHRPTRWNGVVHYSVPTESPTSSPTLTFTPSLSPTSLSAVPSLTPSGQPSMWLSEQPSLHSPSPSDLPSSTPSQLPTLKPSLASSEAPSQVPSSMPSNLPSRKLSRRPTLRPTTTPSLNHSSSPSESPSLRPSLTSGAVPNPLRLAALLVLAASVICYFVHD